MWVVKCQIILLYYIYAVKVLYPYIRILWQYLEMKKIKLYIFRTIKVLFL